MGAGDNTFLFREDFQSRGDHPAKPTLFERFKLWRGGSEPTPTGDPAPAPSFSSAASVARESLETDFRQEFTTRLEEICEVNAQAGSPALGAAQPADAALYLHEVAAGEKAHQAATLGQVSGSLEGLSRTLEGIHDRLSETSRQGAEVQELLADLPEVVQALPAIGRGQLSILSGISSEQRAIGAETVQQFERQIERVHDLAGAIGTVQERTSEVVRSVDELREVLGALPASLQAQAEMLDLTRRNLESLQLQNLEESARLLAGFERQEDVLIEGFVNQTVAIEGVRDGLADLAGKVSEGNAREAEITRPNWSRGWRGMAMASSVAVMLLTFGFGIASVIQPGDTGGFERTDAMLASHEADRSLLKQQLAAVRDTFVESVAAAESERADFTVRLTNLLEVSQRIAQVNKDLENDNAVLSQRVKVLDAENRSLRMSAARRVAAAGGGESD